MSINDWNIDSTWTLFLDRDGVINKRLIGGYVTSVDQFEFLPDVKVAIKDLTSIFQLILVVTNQQGVAKGLMSEESLKEVHRDMCVQIKEVGGNIDNCFYAINLRGDSVDWRKPKPVMAYMAKDEYPQIDFSKSIMVGDTDSDIEFGKNLGMKTVRVQSDDPIGICADLTVESLIEFAKTVKNEI